MFKRERHRLASCIIDDLPVIGESVSPPIQDVSSEYNDIFGHPSPPDDYPALHLIKDSFNLSWPITETDIASALQNFKSSAKGPDFLSVFQLKKVPVRKLVLLYNCMILLSYVPANLKDNRTVLILKGKGDGGDIKNWRPITISSILLRICNKIRGARLSMVPTHAHQSGFKKIDGVFLNTCTLENVIRSRRDKHMPFYIVPLDLQKALDTVSHYSILRALKRFNTDKLTTDFIMESYSNITTKVSIRKNSRSPIKITRGVKQGDLLSPYLFNFILDELICILESKGLGIPLSPEFNLTALAYADDLISLSDSMKKMTSLLRVVSEFLGQRELKLNINKCASLAVNVVPAKKILYTISKSIFYIDGQAIKSCEPNNFFTYLGQKFNYMGQIRPVFDDLRAQLSRIHAAPLKPSQKLCILKTYLWPRYLHLLQTSRVTLHLLKEADKLIRISVRKILHLHRTCSDAYIHAPLREGGLGVQSLKVSVTCVMLRRICTLKNNTDSLAQAALNTPNCIKLEEKLNIWTAGCGGNPAVAARVWGTKLENSYSGNGLRQGIHTQQCSKWMDSPPPYWNGGDFVKGVQLKGIPSNPPAERRCRGGCERVESLCHVLQKCPVTHWQRIRRHDRIVDSMRKMGENRGWKVSREPRVRCSNGSLKIPDLIFEKDNAVVLNDVSVTWRGPNPLQVAYEHKIATHQDQQFLEALSRKYPGKEITVIAKVIGARGIWCKENLHIQQILGLTSSDIGRLKHSTIDGSIIIHSQFGKCAYKR